MNTELRQSKSFKMRLSIVLKAHHKVIEEGERLGRWIENAMPFGYIYVRIHLNPKELRCYESERLCRPGLGC